ncbi:MAG: amino acid ABC transporter permease [Eubacteriales bacterium]|nr:amino acid ABC transporter permease [Eubacteriales bacterium]
MSLSAMLELLIRGFRISVSIFCLTLIFSLPLGLLVSFGASSSSALIRLPIKAYISVMRGTPLMLQLMVVYFGPYYLFGLTLFSSYRFTAAIIGFVVNYAAYFAEIYRGGMQAIPIGQYEAAQALGYTRSQTYVRIVLPQMIKTVLPSLTNEVITLVKDTSLASVLAVSEMFSSARKIASAQTTMLPFAFAGLLYYIFSFISEKIMKYFEKSLNYYN